MAVVLWFRSDLRLDDHLALAEAAALGEPVIPVYIQDDLDAGVRALGGASRWWLRKSLAALAQELAAKGSRLILRRGPAQAALSELIAQTNARAVYFHHRAEPWARAQEAQLEKHFAKHGIALLGFNGAWLYSPQSLQSRAGSGFRVFTPFWKALRAKGDLPAPRPMPRNIPAPRKWPASDDLESWNLYPAAPDWAAGLRETWRPGEKGAKARLKDFLADALSNYPTNRDIPGCDGTARLSPHLAFGEISPRRIWQETIQASLKHAGYPLATGAESFLRQIAWREFAQHMLFHCPETASEPLQPAFARFAWRKDKKAWTAWTQARTGYPIVDAGLRQLWRTGWMHNRVRMIVASFLVKDLLLSWRKGEAWFWDTLVDADMANNIFGWQWAAGCGADAAPFFRIFNPVLQGKRFDPDGAYVRRWIPELKRLPGALIHAPWTAKPIDLKDANIRLGKDYPLPIVDHDQARKRALTALKQIRQS